MESNTDVSDEESQEEDDDRDTEDDTMNQIESINLSSDSGSSESMPVKRKAMFEEPTIALCADDDCGLEIESIDLLSCDAPGCNLTVRKYTILSSFYWLTLLSFILSTI